MAARKRAYERVVVDREVGVQGAPYRSPLADVICKRGDIKALAEALEISPTQVKRWLSGKAQPSEYQALRIEEVTGLSRSRLRPDIWRVDGKRRGKRIFLLDAERHPERNAC